MKLSEIVRRKEGIVSILSGFLALVLLLGTVPVVWAQADPATEIADIIDVCVSNRHLVPRAILSRHATTGKPRGAGATATARD